MSEQSMFTPRGRTASTKQMTILYDADGREIEPETREDEEQFVKMHEIIDLLLAAGYFRARIKGLSPFDKVVGGMTWCITTCNFDVDVDLLFQENSTIGQKIALTEKIVAVLPRMKCPHPIEPHQIQGLDFIHIYPVVQWLVKRAIESRQEMGDYIRSFSLLQFSKNYKMPKDMVRDENKDKSGGTIKTVREQYAPQRRFKRHDHSQLVDEESRVHSTLLEYGQVPGLLRHKTKNSTDKKKLGSDIDNDKMNDEIHAAEQEKIAALMGGMTATSDRKLTASAVGSIVGMQSREIQQMASEYAEKRAELQEAKGERLSGAQRHAHVMASLEKQLNSGSAQFSEVQKACSELKSKHEDVQLKLETSKQSYDNLQETICKLGDIENDENRAVIEHLKSLIAENESLKKQERDFRAKCKEEKSRLETEIEELEASGGSVSSSKDQERTQLIERQHEIDKAKHQKLQIMLARKNRDIATLQRKIDEVPTRAELSQYQRRFVELYNQVAHKLKETKQFYTLYNILDDSRLYISKEINLLNSIHDTFEQAMSSPTTKEQFLKQFEQIVEGVKQNRTKVEKKKQETKMKRDQLSDQYLDIVEKERLYFKTVKDFKDECHKNELLLAKLDKIQQ